MPGAIFVGWNKHVSTHVPFFEGMWSLRGMLQVIPTTRSRRFSITGAMSAPKKHLGRSKVLRWRSVDGLWVLRCFWGPVSWFLRASWTRVSGFPVCPVSQKLNNLVSHDWLWLAIKTKQICIHFGNCFFSMDPDDCTRCVASIAGSYRPTKVRGMNVPKEDGDQIGSIWDEFQITFWWAQLTWQSPHHWSIMDRIFWPFGGRGTFSSILGWPLKSWSGESQDFFWKMWNSDETKSKWQKSGSQAFDHQMFAICRFFRFFSNDGDMQLGQWIATSVVNEQSLQKVVSIWCDWPNVKDTTHRWAPETKTRAHWVQLWSTL